MSADTLNIVISKKDLDAVVSRAGLAAMTEEGQSKMAKTSNETRGCVRIAAVAGKITFESSVSRFSVLHAVRTGEGEGEASILSEGETCVPAKELKIVAGKIKDGRKVSIVFRPMPPDPTLNASSADMAVLPDGVVEIGVISGSKVVSKTKIEAYPSSRFAAPQYPEDSSLTVIMAGKASILKQPCGVVGFSVNVQDLKEVYDKFAFFTSQEGIFFLGSDGRRASVVQVNGSVFDQFLSQETDVPILVDAEFLSPIMASLSDDDALSVKMDEDQERAYFCSGNTTYCVNMVDKALRKKYPNYRRIVGVKTKAVVLVNRDELSETISLLGIVNNDRSRYTFCKDEQVIKVLGRGIGTVKESTGSIGFQIVGEELPKTETISLNTKYLIEGLKNMKCDNIRMSFSEDELRVKIEDETNPAFIYFMQVMNPNEA